MRSAHHCLACDRRLPRCVRADRQYCTSRCRVWAFRHPGQKRTDPTRGRVPLPSRLGQGQPKTLAAALVALADTRKYAAKLEATARAQNTEEQKLLTELAKLRDGLVDVQRELAAEREGGTKTKARLGKVEDEKSAKAKEIYQMRQQIERLLSRLQRTESQARRKDAELDRVWVDLAEARRRNERQAAEEKEKLREAQLQFRELTRVREELEEKIQTLATQVANHRNREELVRRHDELILMLSQLTSQVEVLQRQVEQVEQELKKREEEIKRLRKKPPSNPGGPGEPRSLVDLLQRRLEEEQAQRIAAEQRIAQLLSEIENPDKARQPKADPPSTPPWSRLTNINGTPLLRAMILHTTRSWR